MTLSTTSHGTLLPSKLCRFCTDIVTRDHPDDEILPHHAHLLALSESSENCALCEIFTNCISVEYIHERFGHTEAGTDPRFLLSFTIEDLFRFAGGHWTLLVLDVIVPDHAVIIHRLVSITTCDKDSTLAGQPFWRGSIPTRKDKLSSIVTWFNECIEHHIECQNSPTSLPKRLLDVGLASGTVPRIVRTENLPTTTRFATLSHSWGTIQPLRSLKKNEEEYSTGIGLDLFPQTFFDAIEAAQVLGIQYIWIDSLCIIQDDPQDWAEEAMKMKDVYTGSALTIAASDAFDSSAGCLPQSSPGTTKEHDIRDSKETLPWFLEDLGVLVHVDTGDTREKPLSTHLSTRGWVLQEYVLSHRLLHCMEDELHWQCRRDYKTERGVSFRHSMSVEKTHYFLPSGCRGSANGVWWKWVDDHSGRNFTFESDRVPAIAGLLEEYQQKTGDISILGLWESSFHADLMWIRIKDRKHGPNTARFPSWSWLSCPHNVLHDFFGSVANEFDHVELSWMDNVRLVDWKVTWEGRELVSPVSEAYVILEGKTREFTLHIAPGARDYNPPYFLVDDEEVKENTQIIPWRCAGQFDDPDFGCKDVPTRYTCLLLRSNASIDEDETKWTQESFLMLLEEAKKTMDLPTYRRVGLGSFQSNLNHPPKESDFTGPVQTICIV